jgi:hypothetical protein
MSLNGVPETSCLNGVPHTACLIPASTFHCGNDERRNPLVTISSRASSVTLHPGKNAVMIFASVTFRHLLQFDRAEMPLAIRGRAADRIGPVASAARSAPGFHDLHDVGVDLRLTSWAWAGAVRPFHATA